MAVRELPPEVVAQIAAGEVITRPADVVKELVENAIDAILGHQGCLPGEATLAQIGTVSVEIWEGGYARIQVADDGCGMEAADLPMAVRRHATSKIACADDLYQLTSLGFRGEALAAIAAAGDLTLWSARPAGGVGASVHVVDGKVGPVLPRARRPGTTAIVERLFERVPARRRYQRAPSAETAFIGGLLQSFACAYPEIAFSLESNGRPVFRTSGSGDLRDTAVALFGPEAARELLTLRDNRDLEDESYRHVAITGLVGSPSLHRATRNGILLSINRRPVESRSLVYALEEAYTTQLPVGRHPVAILDLTVPPEDVDANVHPTKREVRLIRDRLAFSLLQRAVRGTLAEVVGIPRFGETRGRPPDLPSVGDGVLPLFPESIAPGEAEPVPRPDLGHLRILGQVALTYIICEGEAGLYLVDQHAAHERVLLERLERRIGAMDRSQLLLDPLAVELPSALRASLDEYIAALDGLGFSAEPLGQDAVVIRAVPSALRTRDLDRVLWETHEALAEEGIGPDWRDRLAVLLSCKTAIKAGQKMEILEMQALLSQLDEANLCATCSHGRPTAILLSHSQLEREFGRR